MERHHANANSVRQRLRPVARLSPDATVTKAARTMYEWGTEAVVIVNGNGEVVGVFTPHDLVAVVSLGLDPARTRLVDWIASPRCSIAQHPAGEAWLG